jgi:DNA-binding transcriptional LysR family regulator
VLTEAGETFLPYAHRALAATHNGVAALQALEEQEQGTITLALVGTLASTDLTVRFQQFRQAHPHYRLILSTDSPQQRCQRHGAKRRGASGVALLCRSPSR